MTEVDPSPRAVINASPLIFLSKGGYLDLLELISEEILVPDPVAAEIRQRGLDDVTANALEKTDWLRVVPAPVISTVIGSWDLGPGESAVLALAHEVSGEAIIDARAGRRCAASLEIPVRGTLRNRHHPDPLNGTWEDAL